MLSLLLDPILPRLNTNTQIVAGGYRWDLFDIYITQDAKYWLVYLYSAQANSYS
jgi:hypothetical protein